MPDSGPRSAAAPRPSSAPAKSSGRLQWRPSGRRTGRFGKRCTSSSSTRSPTRRPAITRPLDAPRSMAAWTGGSLKVEHLAEPAQSGVRPIAGGEVEERRHLRLPSGVDACLVHAPQGGREVVRLEVADKGAVVGEEERVVAPARVAQCLQHLWPDGPMALAVL